VSVQDAGEGKIGFWKTAAIGVGGMVGGGIFAVLGLAVQLAGGGTPIAFGLSGLLALITCYAYTRLSVAYPSQGGTVEFLNQAFGPGTITGGLNVLLWLSYVVMLALYALAFGSYGASLISGAHALLWKHLLTSGVVVLFAVLNISGTALVGSVEGVVVGLKLLILTVFVVAGAASANGAQLAPGTWASPLNLVAGGMVIFLAYEGFELIANTAGDVRNPRQTLPRAYFASVGFVVLLYVAISAVTIGNLSLDKIVKAEDYALAAAARPFLGQAGFALIAVAALLSTGSAINATLYGAGRLSYTIAKEGELPKELERKVWRRPIEGLLITSGLTLLLANVADLSRIAVMGSAGFLVIFGAVNAAAFRLHRRIHCNRLVAAAGVTACALALGALVWQRLGAAPEEIIVLPVMLVVAFGSEVVYRRWSGKTRRRLVDPEPPDPDVA
jgi:amino acid transporter